jgi:hypothetical protein
MAVLQNFEQVFEQVRFSVTSYAITCSAGRGTASARKGLSRVSLALAFRECQQFSETSATSMVNERRGTLSGGFGLSWG